MQIITIGSGCNSGCSKDFSDINFLRQFTIPYNFPEIYIKVYSGMNIKEILYDLNSIMSSS